MRDRDPMVAISAAVVLAARDFGACFLALDDAVDQAMDAVASWLAEFERQVDTEVTRQEYRRYERNRQRAVERSRRNNDAMRKRGETR